MRSAKKNADSKANLSNFENVSIKNPEPIKKIKPLIGSTVKKNNLGNDIATQEQFKSITGGDDLTEEDKFLLQKAFEE